MEGIYVYCSGMCSLNKKEILGTISQLTAIVKIFTEKKNSFYTFLTPPFCSLALSEERKTPIHSHFQLFPVIHNLLNHGLLATFFSGFVCFFVCFAVDGDGLLETR